MARLSTSALLTLALVGSSIAAPVAIQMRALPTPVTAATARTYVSELTVADEVNSPAYARSEFKTWDISTPISPILTISLLTSAQSQGRVTPERVRVPSFGL